MGDDAQESRPPNKRTSKRRGTTASEPVSEFAEWTFNDIRSARLATAEHKRKLESDRLKHELDSEREDAQLRRKKEWVLTVAMLVMGGIVTAICAGVFFLPGSSESLKDKALTSLIGLMTAGLGFVLGKSLPKS